MHLKKDELKIEQYRRNDDMPCAAVRVHHRHSDSHLEINETNSPRENLRRCLVELVQRLNPNPETITTPKFYPCDDVILRLPESIQEGKIEAIDFDFKTKRWKYDVACKERHANGEYDAADLELRSVDDLA